METVAHITFWLGGVICLLNFYLSFLRYPIYKLLKKEYKWVSGVPVLGSVFAAVSLLFLYEITWMLISGLVFIAIDMGGLHWFAVFMIYNMIAGTDDDSQKK